MPAVALEEFRRELDRARSLLSLEVKHFRDPPGTLDAVTVNSLRAGAAVLMVASFESFLADLSAECVDQLRTPRRPITFDKLDAGLRVANVFGTLEAAMKGPLYGKPGSREARLPDVHLAAGIVAAKQLNPTVFGNARGNPDKECVKQVFRDVGYSDIFGGCRARFERRWGVPSSAKSIGEMLDTIVRRRHAVAHGSSGLSISRADLRESLKFLRILAEVLDIEMRQHFRHLTRRAM